MGWSVSRISSDDKEFSAELMDYGTIIGRGKGTKLIIGILDQVDGIIKRHGVDIFCCEDFLYNRGRRLKGIFVVPALIGVLKYHWFRLTGEEAIIVPAPTWKTKICGNPGADKDDIRTSMIRYLKEDTIMDIEAHYREMGGKGEQDCIDSIALNLYVCNQIGINRQQERDFLL